MTKTIEIELTEAELRYLMCVVSDNVKEGSYWGNEVQFRNMQSRVADKLEDALFET